MKVLVAVKRVIDFNVKPRVKMDGSGVDLKVPLVVRLEGTNVQQGKDILAQSGLAIVPANDLGDAARKIVAEVKNPVAA